MYFTLGLSTNPDNINGIPLCSWVHEMGSAEGLREGLAKGLAKGYAEVVLLQLRKRFGQVPPDVDEAIRALPPDQLLDLAGALLDITTLAELRAWLTIRLP